jgi:chromosomal replication initiator protein
VLKKNPACKIKYTSSERFTGDLIESIKNQRIGEFKELYQKIDLLIIDDIQFLSGKEKTQEEFFHIFNFLYQLNKQIVLSSDCPPKAIPTLEERLRSRFEGGMIADIGQADFETRMAILRKKALNEGLEIEDEALEFIASNITSNIRELEGALNRVSASAQLTQEKITLKLVSSLLSEIVSSSRKKGITYKHIIKVVSDFYEIRPDDLLIKIRKREIVKPRQIIMYLMRSELNYSYPGIGERLGGRDHTTAIHAFEKIKKELTTNEKLIEEIDVLKKQLYTLC